MTTTKNKIQIEKCIISFSHNKYDSRRLADKFSIAKAKGEIAAGKNGISHLILRSRDDEIDRLKFLFLIHGIPLMCYSLGNLICSSLKEIVVVGSDEVQRVLEKFLSTVDTCGKKIQFVNDCIGDEVEQVISKLNNGDILLLENLRFYEEETNVSIRFLNPGEIIEIMEKYNG